MGHGLVRYRGEIMANCHEDISNYVGERLAELACQTKYFSLAPTVSLWRQALEMPPGCSVIELDQVLLAETMKGLFVEALTQIHDKLGSQRMRDQVRQLITFLMLGERALDTPYKPDRPDGI